MKEFQNKLNQMYELARDSMNARQQKANTDYDRKVKADPLDTNTLVYVYLPRNERKKLKLKWDGPHKIVTAKHPVYEVKQGDTSNTKWLTRDKLRKCESGAVLRETPNPEWTENDTRPPLVESSDESEYEMDPENQVMENENDREPNNQHYNMVCETGVLQFNIPFY